MLIRRNKRKAWLPTPCEIDLLQSLRGNGGPSFSLQIVSKSEGKIKKGTVHAYLKGLESRGLVKSSLEELPEDFPRPSRRMYELTDLGYRTLSLLDDLRDAFDAWTEMNG